MEKLTKLSNELILEAGKYTIERIGGNKLFEEEDAFIKKEVAKVHGQNKDYDLAIDMLKKIIGGGAQRIVDADEKACIYISIKRQKLSKM